MSMTTAFSLRYQRRAMVAHMKMKSAVIAATVAASALGSIAIAAVPLAQQWEIGPIIRGKNYSVGMPLQPVATPKGWYFDFPHNSRADGHVHYVTFAPGSLAGKSQIVVRYKVTAARGTRFVPQEHPELPGAVSLFFQRRGDTWSAKGRYEHYRWYAPNHAVQNIAPGVHQMTVSLRDPEWISVFGKNPSENPAAYAAALRDTDRLGLVFGSTAARGHGVFATAPARFELLSFAIK